MDPEEADTMSENLTINIIPWGLCGDNHFN